MLTKNRIYQIEKVQGRRIDLRRHYNKLHGGEQFQCSKEGNAFKHTMLVHQKGKNIFFPDEVSMVPPVKTPLIHLIVYSRKPCNNLTHKLFTILYSVSPKTFSEPFTAFKNKAAAWLRSTPKNRQPSVFFENDDPPIEVLEDMQTYFQAESWADINDCGFVTDDTQPGACRKLDPWGMDSKYYLPQLEHYCKRADVTKGGYIRQTFYACGWMEEPLFQALIANDEFKANFEYAHRHYKDGRLDSSKPIDETQEFYTFQELSAE